MRAHVRRLCKHKINVPENKTIKETSHAVRRRISLIGSSQKNNLRPRQHCSMMLRGKSTVATLSILVAVATALPYSEWNHARYGWNDLFAARGQEVAARVRSQATVETSSCATITERKDGKSYRVRVCTADPEGISSCTKFTCTH